MDIKQEIPYPTPIRRILLGTGLAPKLKDLLAAYKNPIIVCDTNTENLLDIGTPKKVYPAPLKALVSHARELSAHDADIFIALGSGTINDITKYASFLANKPYVVFATAASMNGYASGGASLIESGHKKSFIARPALEILLDTEVISSAPAIMRASGIADAISVLTCKQDLLLAKQITGQTDHKELVELTERYLDKMTANLEALLKTLILGGIAMNMAGTSAPQSQGEHMLAHYMDMRQETSLLHGQQIAVTTLAMARKMENAGTEVSIANYDESELKQHFGNLDFAPEARAKYEGIAGKKFKIVKPAISSAQIEELLKSAGAPTTTHEIGWDESIFADALKYARYTRNRLTFLDVI